MCHFFDNKSHHFNKVRIQFSVQFDHHWAKPNSFALEYCSNRQKSLFIGLNLVKPLYLIYIRSETSMMFQLNPYVLSLTFRQIHVWNVKNFLKDKKNNFNHKYLSVHIANNVFAIRHGFRYCISNIVQDFISKFKELNKKNVKNSSN